MKKNLGPFYNNNMSSWASDIKWDDSALQSMMSSKSATPSTVVTSAPVTAAPLPAVLSPVTQAPSYSVNPSYGQNVVMPLPIAPSLLLSGGNIGDVNPITPAPTSAPIKDEEPQIQYIPPPPPPKKNKTMLYVGIAILVIILLGLLAYFFLGKSGKNNAKNGKSGKNNAKNGKSGKNNAKNGNLNLNNFNNLNNLNLK